MVLIVVIVRVQEIHFIEVTHGLMGDAMNISLSLYEVAKMSCTVKPVL